MPRKNFKTLRDQVMARPGAAERVAALREEMIGELRLEELRQVSDSTTREGGARSEGAGDRAEAE